MKLKDRIKSFKRIKASLLKQNPKNWRIHNEPQHAALRAILKEVGFTSACLVRDCKNGTYELIDGHLRAEIAQEEKVPCLILDVTKSEANQILATFDSVTSMANTDQAALNNLINSIPDVSDDLQELLDQLSSNVSELLEMTKGEDESHLLLDSFSVLIDCQSESEQVSLLKRFKKEGLQCRAWIS
ncbi:ParB/RepB/Spo0J family partition protein [Gimesia fumaroli]|uniref:ParB-like nuclease domain protein n=1 Tax=Gimesia fumaroli TaxID=2527976 RepID=A0A518ILA1_9PLAN|nr:ParB N-terminal domain-containing protein [Gimesia fumaroli]QDV53882.1 ParB-like nuclease domain protein [Gimesia fumaroli]